MITPHAHDSADSPGARRGNQLLVEAHRALTCHLGGRECCHICAPEGCRMSEWKTVLVGVDGSPASRAALRWAAAEAEEHRCELVAVRSYAPAMPPIGGGASAPRDIPDPAEDATTQLLQTITEELGDNPPVKVQPTGHLRERGPTADWAVGGSRPSRGRQPRPRRFRRTAARLGESAGGFARPVHGLGGSLNQAPELRWRRHSCNCWRRTGRRAGTVSGASS